MCFSLHGTNVTCPQPGCTGPDDVSTEHQDDNVDVAACDTALRRIDTHDPTSEVRLQKDYDCLVRGLVALSVNMLLITENRLAAICVGFLLATGEQHTTACNTMGAAPTPIGC